MSPGRLTPTTQLLSPFPMARRSAPLPGVGWQNATAGVPVAVAVEADSPLTDGDGVGHVSASFLC